MMNKDESLLPAPGGGCLVPLDLQPLARALIGATNPLAIPNGTRVRKCNSDKSDRTKDGALGTVVGGIPAPCQIKVNGHDILQAYVIEWDGDIAPDKQQQRVLCMDYKIERVR